MGIGTAAGAVGPSQPAMDVETASYQEVLTDYDERRLNTGLALGFEPPPAFMPA